MQQQKKSENFSALIYKYKKAALPDSPGDVSDLAAMLESLEAIDQVKSISDQQAIEIILSGLRCIDHQHALSRPFCRLIYNLCFKQVRSNSSFKTSQFDMCIKYILDGLSTVDNQDYKVELLRALSALVFENTQNTQRHADQLADLLLKMANASSKPLEVRRMAINCIGNTCSSPLSGTQLQKHTEAFYVCLLGNLGVVDQQKTTSSLDFNDTAIRKVASSTLRALRFLLTQDKTLVSHPLCDIIELIYTFIFMHVNVQSYSVGINHPPTSTVTRRNRLSSQPSIRLPLQLSWRVPLQQKPLSLVTSSESELSDSSMLTELSPRRQRDNAKIRINALLCLCAIATVSPKSLYPHWHKFIPDTFSIFLSNNMNSKDQQLPALLKSDNQPYSLLTILLYDPILNVRSTVCHTLVAILNESKQYLSIASESGKNKSSFTSLSENLGSIVHDLHQGLIYALNKEQSNQVVSLIMNVIAVLVTNCSYEKLSKQHLPSLLTAVSDHWGDETLHTSVLKTISVLLSVPQDNMNSLINKEVIDILLESVKSDEKDVQTEGWYACTSLTKHYPSEAYSLWTSFDSNNMHPLPISVASLRYMESYANLIQDQCNESNQQWWQDLILKYMQKSSLDESSAVRTAACDCFASLSKTIFEGLSFACQRLAITLLFSLSSDSDVHVKAAACRALGVFVSFESLREDPLFISDTIKAILSQKEDKTVLVRVRTSWSIANLCDALVLESVKPEFNLREYMSTTDWIDILNMIIAALDHEKCKSNAVRAIGSLLRLTPKEYYDNMRIMALVKHAVLGVIKHIETGSLKTRWNACYAASNMLQNLHFPIGFVEKEGGLYPWTHSLYSALIHALTDCKNFKVRINACLALTAAQREIQYGDKLAVIAKSIIDAWDHCQTNTAYKEIKYKQQLEQQILDSLAHIYNWIPIHLKDKVNHMMHSFSHAKSQ